MHIGDYEEVKEKSHFSLARSMASEGGLSKLTTFTNCTNPTFDNVHRKWRWVFLYAVIGVFLRN